MEGGCPAGTALILYPSGTFFLLFPIVETIPCRAVRKGSVSRAILSSGSSEPEQQRKALRQRFDAALASEAEADAVQIRHVETSVPQRHAKAQPLKQLPHILPAL